jgi:DUF917 family protein
MSRDPIRRWAVGAAAAVVLLLGHSATDAQVAAVRTLSEQEMVDMMVGSSIQATRASNSASLIRQVRSAIAEGRKFTMIDLDAVGDGWVFATSGAVGGGGAWDFVAEETAKHNVPPIPDPTANAVELLRKYSRGRIDAVVRVEAAAATLQAFMVASQLGVPVIDTCLSARARPETGQSIPAVQGVKRSGLTAMSTRWGDTIVFDNVAAPIRLEHLMRGLAVSSGGVIYSASTPYTGAQMKAASIRGSVSQAILWGRTVRQAVETGQDPVAALTRVSNGYLLFQGVVAKAEMKGDKGFTYWDVELTGTSRYAGHSYRVYVKNENIVTWLDGKPDAMSPDFISNLDPKTGDAIAGGAGLGAYPIGRAVAMVGIPASPMWRAPAGIDVFGPRHFGFDFDYVPIEQQMKRRPQF